MGAARDRFERRRGQPGLVDEGGGGVQSAGAYRCLAAGIHSGGGDRGVEVRAGAAEAADQGAAGESGFAGDRDHRNVGNVFAEGVSSAQRCVHQIVTHGCGDSSDGFG